MADITACQNKQCPIKDSCYRYSLFDKPNDPYQSFGEFTPDKDWHCDAYIAKRVQ